MPAYIIVLVDITDRERYADYMKVTPSVVAEFGGRFIARGVKTETLEGPPETRRVVLIEFPSYELASAFYQSHEYQRAIAGRRSAKRFLHRPECARWRVRPESHPRRRLPARGVTLPLPTPYPPW